MPSLNRRENHGFPSFDSVDLRFGDRCGAFEKIEVASFVGLFDVL